MAVAYPWELRWVYLPAITVLIHGGCPPPAQSYQEKPTRRNTSRNLDKSKIVVYITL
jgi:hypothetical protein